MSLGRSGPSVRSGFFETPRTRFGGVFLASAQAASQFGRSQHMTQGNFGKRCEAATGGHASDGRATGVTCPHE